MTCKRGEAAYEVVKAVPQHRARALTLGGSL